ncbi:MAG: TetR/AcrR family transcriptional regulator [Caldilineaceae bacterium]|nr:TetR/AcrR family transcriptional regulator [Caldilineaceae bacterium]
MSQTRRKRHVRTKQAILDAAVEIIGEEGPDALSMRSLADRIDYSAAGLYEYFNSKEAIIAAACQLGQGMLYDSMAQVDPNLPAADYVYQLGVTYIRFALDHPDYFLLIFTTAPQPNTQPDPSAAVQDALHSEGSAYGILLRGIERGIDDGSFRTRPGFALDEMAYAAWGVVHGVAMLRVTALRHLAGNLSAADEQVLHNFLRGLKGE